jgi:hypothetical protein
VKNEVGELFGLLSHSFPYDRVLGKLGYESMSQPPRSAVITAALERKGISPNMVLAEQNKLNVSNMWEGLDRYLKTQEISGKQIYEAICYQEKS